MSDVKTAKPAYAVQEFIARRWSPYSLDAERPVSEEDLRSLFEAARWAPSAFNEQPWRYLVATRGEEAEFARLLACLVEPNQAWARNAAVLALGVVSLTFSRNGKANGTALHDLGLASSNLCAEATARGIAVHQMSGILPDRAREEFGIPDGFQVVTALAIGYAGAPGDPDRKPRERRPQSGFVFTGGWESARP